MFEGSCNTQVFNTWLEEMLVPDLVPGKVVILDNASFHKSTRTIELIEAAGCRVLFLPPYSPDYNPIEHFWHKLKSAVKKLLPVCEDFQSAIVSFFQSIPTLT